MNSKTNENEVILGRDLEECCGRNGYTNRTFKVIGWENGRQELGTSTIKNGAISRFFLNSPLFPVKGEINEYITWRLDDDLCKNKDTATGDYVKTLRKFSGVGELGNFKNKWR